MSKIASLIIAALLAVGCSKPAYNEAVTIRALLDVACTRAHGGAPAAIRVGEHGAVYLHCGERRYLAHWSQR